MKKNTTKPVAQRKMHPMASARHRPICSSGNGRRRRFILSCTSSVAAAAAVSLFATPPGCAVEAFRPPLVPTPTATVPLSLPLQATRAEAAPDRSRWSALRTRSRTRLCLSNGDKNNNNNNNNKNLSNSERGRREEDRRRKQRRDDVVIGKTSAKRGAKDYPLDPEATEREYLRQASREEQLVHACTDEGMEALKSLRLEDADRCFDRVFELKPDTYLWLAGIVKFYLGDMEGASSIFARSAIHFEKKFGPMGMGPASEERIWRNAAELKHVQSLKRSEKKKFYADKERGVPTTPPIAQIHGDGDTTERGDDSETLLGPETRKIHRLARELFDASASRQKAAEAVARAQLLSVAESEPSSASGGSGGRAFRPDVKKRKLNACYFLALHYDVVGEVAESKKWIKTAFRLCHNSMGKSSDILDTLPLLHMTARDWFDDDPYGDEDDENDENGDSEKEVKGVGDSTGTADGDSDSTAKPIESSDDDDDESEEAVKASLDVGTGTTTNAAAAAAAATTTSTHMSEAYSDPVLEASIMEDVEKMRFVEIKEALRIRGISVTGSKDTLKERLFISLMDDAGYQSGFAP